MQQKKELENDIASLNDRLAKSHASLKGLCRQQLNLEEEIAIKTNTLFIDEVECMGMRKSITIHAY
ncbi:unnamed protein product [Protopolystoma xenopodis]|uniref:Tektin n=1 Tax=Protopolystoma xenopodis TaxID=117903 RepID=A0A3S5BGB0_9PLAT|nr:unnamed protein product [Protopolystoma xenopodis]